MKKRVILILCVLAVCADSRHLSALCPEDRYHRHCHGIPVQ